MPDAGRAPADYLGLHHPFTHGGGNRHTRDKLQPLERYKQCIQQGQSAKASIAFAKAASDLSRRTESK